MTVDKDREGSNRARGAVALLLSAALVIAALLVFLLGPLASGFCTSDAESSGSCSSGAGGYVPFAIALLLAGVITGVLGARSARRGDGG